VAIPASTKKVRSPASSMRSTLVFLLLCGIVHAEERLWTRAFRHGSRLPHVPGRVDPSVDAVPSVDAIPSDSVPSFDPVQENGDTEDADVQKNVPGGGDPAPGVASVPSVTPVQTNFGRCEGLNEEACCKAEPDTTAPCFYVGRFTKMGGKDQLSGWKCQNMGAMSYQMNSRGTDGHYWEVQKCRTAEASATEDEEVVSVGTEAKCNAIGDDCAACEQQGCAYFSVPGSSGGGIHGVATEANGFCSGVKYALNQKVGQKNGMYTKTTCV